MLLLLCFFKSVSTNYNNSMRQMRSMSPNGETQVQQQQVGLGVEEDGELCGGAACFQANK